MNLNHLKRATALITVCAFLATGCTSLQNVPLTRNGQASERPDVKAGESVVVTKKDGTTQKFTVLSVEDDALAGHNVRVPYADIASLEVKRSDGGGTKTALIVGAVVVGIAGIAAASGGGGGGHGSGY
jgi:hypothetical protein